MAAHDDDDVAVRRNRKAPQLGFDFADNALRIGKAHGRRKIGAIVNDRHIKADLIRDFRQRGADMPGTGDDERRLGQQSVLDIDQIAALIWEANFQGCLVARD